MLGEVNTTMRRSTGSRRAGLAKTSKVRRCLFGPVDHEVLNNDLQKGMQDASVQNKLRWNFDFEKECPMSGGRYDWTAVDSSEYVPAVYGVCYAARERVRRAAGVSRTVGLKRASDSMEGSPCGDEENTIPLTPEDSTTPSTSSSTASPTLGVRRVLRFSPVATQTHIPSK